MQSRVLSDTAWPACAWQKVSRWAQVIVPSHERCHCIANQQPLYITTTPHHLHAFMRPCAP
jgi:hypothetical protein